MRHTAMPHARRMRAAAQRGSWVKFAHVRTLTIFFSVFSLAVIQLTVVASLHRADVFGVRLGGHCREFGVKHVQTARQLLH